MLPEDSRKVHNKQGTTVMAAIVTDPDQISEIIERIIKQALEHHLPPLIKRVARKPWLTKQELKELTGWSNRTIQHLRDTKQIPFSQHGRKILYPTEQIEQFLKDHSIKPQN